MEIPQKTGGLLGGLCPSSPDPFPSERWGLGTRLTIQYMYIPPSIISRIFVFNFSLIFCSAMPRLSYKSRKLTTIMHVATHHYCSGCIYSLSGNLSLQKTNLEGSYTIQSTSSYTFTLSPTANIQPVLWIWASTKFLRACKDCKHSD